MRRQFRPLLALMPVAFLAPMPLAGCSCSVDCPGAAVGVDLGDRSGAGAARICINEACETVSDSHRWPAGWAELQFGAVPVTVRDNEDFELRIAVLDAGGVEIARIAETRNFDVEKCACLSFEYRWDGTNVERTR